MKKSTVKTLLTGVSVIIGILGTAQSYTISTFAGTGTSGYNGDGINATAAQLNMPTNVFIDSLGNCYIADNYNSRVRLVNTSSIISTIAGNGVQGYTGDGGSATIAEINSTGLCTYGATLYLADYINERVRKVNGGNINTYAGNGSSGFSGDGGQATSAQLWTPQNVGVDNKGNILICDADNYRIRKVMASTGIISTIAGMAISGYSGDGGQATSAALSTPVSVACDTSGNVFISDFGNNRIRMVNSTGIITTVVGNGTAGFFGDGGAATLSELYFPAGVTLDANGNIYIADSYNNRIRMVTKSNGVINTIAGNGTLGFSGDAGAATSAELNGPVGVSLNINGDVFIADQGNSRIRKLSKITTDIITAGNETHFSLYPNPSNGNFILLSSSSIKNAYFQVFGVDGKFIKKIGLGSDTTPIILNELTPGIYIYQITSKIGMCISEGKLIITK